ncbi:MAG TPA: porin family protein [Puia sp.]|jgi:hypothetical protein|nr:porin family protein [Puia sp.]
MRKVLPILALLALFQIGQTSAQMPWLGVHGGLSIPDLSGGNGNQLSSDYTSRLAANFGIQGEWHIYHRFSLQVELNFAGQGGQRNGIQPITNLPAPLQSMVPPGSYLYANFKNKAVLNYLELPILAKFTWGRTLQFYADAGVYVGYLLHAEEKTSDSSTIYVDQKGTPLTVQGYPVPGQNFTANTDITSSIKRFNVGVTGGVGLALPLDAHNKVFFDARFEYGLINIQKYSADGSNNTGNVLLSLGWSHRFRR